MSSSEDDDEYFEVEKILNHTYSDNGKIYYYIKWKNYDPMHNTWEPEENLNCPDLQQQYHEKCDKKSKKNHPETKKKDKTTNSDSAKQNVNIEDKKKPGQQKWCLPEDSTINKSGPLSIQDTQQSFFHTTASPLSTKRKVDDLTTSLPLDDNNQTKRGTESIPATTTTPSVVTTLKKGQKHVIQVSTQSSNNTQENVQRKPLINKYKKLKPATDIKSSSESIGHKDLHSASHTTTSKSSTFSNGDRESEKQPKISSFTPVLSTPTKLPLAISAERPSTSIKSSTIFGIKKRNPHPIPQGLSLDKLLEEISSPRLSHQPSSSQAINTDTSPPSTPASPSSSSATKFKSVDHTSLRQGSQSSSSKSSSTRPSVSERPKMGDHRIHQTSSSDHAHSTSPVITKPSKKQQHSPTLTSQPAAIAEYPLPTSSESSSSSVITSLHPPTSLSAAMSAVSKNLFTGKPPRNLRHWIIRMKNTEATISTQLTLQYDPWTLEKNVLAFLRDSEAMIETYAPSQRVQSICQEGNYCIMTMSPPYNGFMNWSKLHSFLHLNQQSAIVRSRKHQTEVVVITGSLEPQHHSGPFFVLYIKDLMPDFVQRDQPQLSVLESRAMWKTVVRYLNFPEELADLDQQHDTVVEVYGDSAMAYMLRAAIQSSTSTLSSDLPNKVLLFDRCDDSIYKHRFQSERFSLNTRMYVFGYSLVAPMAPVVEVFPKKTGCLITTDAKNILLDPDVLEKMVEYTRLKNNESMGTWQVILHPNILSHLMHSGRGLNAQIAISNLLMFMNTNDISVVEDWEEESTTSNTSIVVLSWYNKYLYSQIHVYQAFLYVDNSSSFTDHQKQFPAIDFIQSNDLR